LIAPAKSDPSTNVVDASHLYGVSDGPRNGTRMVAANRHLPEPDAKHASGGRDRSQLLAAI